MGLGSPIDLPERQDEMQLTGSVSQTATFLAYSIATASDLRLTFHCVHLRAVVGATCLWLDMAQRDQLAE